VNKDIKKEILCTIGPASRNEKVIKRLEDLGVTLFRINLSHTSIDDLAEVIEFIQKLTTVPICLDTEGAQVRTGKLKETSLNVNIGQLIQIPFEQIVGDETKFNFYPADIAKKCQVGDIISIDFNSVLIQVIEQGENALTARVITGGKLGQNKAVSIDREIAMTALTEKDLNSIEIGLKMGINHFALSFANKGEDVKLIRSLVGKNKFIISKIESCQGVNNLEAIAKQSDAILIDRGDLSRQIPIEQVPRVQKEIGQRIKHFETKFYIATNLLETMIESSVPTRAEVNDVFNSLVDGVDGLVLAAETAIGKYPIESAVMISKMIAEYGEFKKGRSFSSEELHRKGSLFLVEPHGGVLVERFSKDNLGKIQEMRKLIVSHEDIINAEQIAVGSFSPLEGFMGKEELESVLKDMRLPGGLVWPLPILLQIKDEKAKDLKVGKSFALCVEGEEDVYAVLHLDEIFNYDLDKIATEVFHTTEEAHPGVRKLMHNGNCFLGGKIDLVKRFPSSLKYFELTPKQTRLIFENKGWSRIVGFHTRNVVHRAHEFIQLEAFERLHCDGLFIHPLVGPKKSGDFNPDIICKCYDLMVSQFYPKGKVLLGAFQNYPRYSGPREAVFTAICRKNFGCSHFIVGRDHSGVGNYYQKDGAHKLFDELGYIGIKPIYFNEVHYCLKCDQYVESCSHSESNILQISGTQCREMFKKSKIPPAWFMREEISRMIISDINDGKEVFVE